MKINAIEEKHHVVEELNKESFEEFYGRYSKERDEINDILKK